MEFTQKALYCKKGHLVPVDGYRTDRNGLVKTNSDGIPLVAGPMIACPECAESIYVPPGVQRLLDPPRRLRRGEVVKEQLSIKDVCGDIPMLRIT
jgi:hypothetical protein